MIEQKAIIWYDWETYDGQIYRTLDNFLNYLIEKEYIIQNYKILSKNLTHPDKALVLVIKNDENAKINLNLF